MPSSQTRSVRRPLAWSLFRQVGSLLQQMVHPDPAMDRQIELSQLEENLEAAEVFVLTDAQVSAIDCSSSDRNDTRRRSNGQIQPPIDRSSPLDPALDPLLDQFVVVVSSRFSGLLRGQSDPDNAAICLMHLEFNSSAIDEFLTQFLRRKARSSQPSPLQQQIAQAKQHLNPNSAEVQSEFTLRLLELLAGTDKALAEPTIEETARSVPAETALLQQIEQERLLNEVTSLIRQSLELPIILETAVQQVRQLLQTDRLLIYQFNIPAPSCLLIPGSEPPQPLNSETLNFDGITYEARRSDRIPSVLHLIEEYSAASAQWLWETYHSSDQKIHHQTDHQTAGPGDYEGNTSDVNDRNRTQNHPQGQVTARSLTETSPLLQRLPQSQVKAELVTPIVVQNELWGLLIAHQCFETRDWQPHETGFLQRIAEHLAIAINQARLYSELQAQKQLLEQEVVMRTQELRDTLIAAQAADRAKTEFLATMSHELRTPLTTIIGMAATLLRYYNNPTSLQTLTLQKQQDYLLTIQNRGENLLALINDILNLSEVEAGRVGLKIQRFSLTQICRQLITAFKDRAANKQVKLSLELQPGLDRVCDDPDLMFFADPQRVHQILQNLLSNAIKFTPEQGRVTLRVWVYKQHAMLQVEDSGIGIPENQRSMLFQKFQQLDGSYHRKYEGTGLGLALTKQLVEMHGGSIEVESTVGVGSKFTVHLPEQVLSAVEQARDRSSIAPPDTHPRIVLIEQHEETAMLVCNLLTAADYQVIWMMDGSTAFKQIEVLQPEVVIVDVDLQYQALITQLRQQESLQPIKILALATDPHPSLTVVVEEIITKPIAPEDLIDKVTGLVARSSE